MQIYNDIADVPALEQPIITVGTFDGVHQGHQEIFRRMKELSEQTGRKTVVITFEPHPRLALSNNEDEIKLINIPQKKIERVASTGIDYLLIIEFTPAFAALSPEQFIADYLVEQLHIGTLVIGYDHHFGKGRGGDYRYAETLGEKYNFKVVEVGEVFVGDRTVSSTKIRNALKEGDIELANRYLGYQYSITGKVVQGNMIGRTLGYPTINIELLSKYKLIAKNGVYACYAFIKGRWYLGMANIGTRPTLPDNVRTMEVNVFDFDESVYGEIVTVAFVKRIRDEIKFANLEQLRQQLGKDKLAVEQILSESEIKP